MIDRIYFIKKLLKNNKSINDFEELEIAIDPLLKLELDTKREKLFWKLMYFSVYEGIEQKRTWALARIDFATNNKGIEKLKEWLLDTGLYESLKDWYLNGI